MNNYQPAELDKKGTNRVTVKVILSNLFDESLVERGLLERGQIHVNETEAFVDTSNVHSALAFIEFSGITKKPGFCCGYYR